jgi:hypothetical protein
LIFEMARSLNDFRNRRQRETLTRGVRPLMASAREDVDGWGRVFAVIAVALLVLGMVVRIVGVVLAYRATQGMTFTDMGNTDYIMQTLKHVSSSLAVATDWLVFAGASSFAGIVFGWTAIVKKRCRAPWLLPTFVALALVHLPLVPLGTLIAAVSLWYLFRHRHEFSLPKPVIAVSP